MFPVPLKRVAIFLGTVSSNFNSTKPTIDVSVNGVNVKFRVDTGADVTVIPNDVFKLFANVKLLPSPQILTGPESNCLNVSGKFNETALSEYGRTRHNL